ncbi:MAG: hypothetical protein IT170_14320 [Bryobacterales bacterium]|nr:hypothetical protein [Bryobacterales bacterium]
MSKRIVFRCAALAVWMLTGALAGLPLAYGGAASLAGASASFAIRTRPFFNLSALQAAQTDASTPPSSSENEIPVYLPGGDEAGPTLPSQRGIGAIRSSEGLFRIAPYLGISGIYDTGLAPLTLRPDGVFPSRSAAGVDLSFGITGSKAFRRSMLNLMYRGGYSHYPKIPYLSNSNHQGVLGVTHAFSRRLQLSSQNTFGYLNNSFFGNFGFEDLGNAGSILPTDEFFNSPVLFLQTNQTLSYQKSARLSFSAGGGGSMHWRRSSALAGVKAGNILGNTSYRISARQTIGVTYIFNQFFFTNQYGGSNVHTMNVEYGAKLSRTVDLSLSLGGARVESQSLERVEVDPLIAQLFGTTGGIEAVYRKSYLPTFQADLRYNKRRWSAGVYAGRAVNPGNGIVLTNRNTSVGASVRYSARRWNAGGGVNYNEMVSLKLGYGNYKSRSADIGFSVVMGRGFSWANTFSVRRYGGDGSVISNTFFDRNQYRVSTGIFWSPSSFPLPLF